MKYKEIWKKVLNSNEEVKYEFSIGEYYQNAEMIIFIVWGIFLAILSWVFVGILFAIFGVLYFKIYLKTANAYAFTKDRVLIHRGWLSTKLISTEYQKITDVTIEEPYFSKSFFKTGNIIINTAGTSAKEIILKNIENPYEVKKKLDELRSGR